MATKPPIGGSHPPSGMNYPPRGTFDGLDLVRPLAAPSGPRGPARAAPQARPDEHADRPAEVDRPWSVPGGLDRAPDRPDEPNPIYPGRAVGGRPRR